MLTIVSVWRFFQNWDYEVPFCGGFNPTRKVGFRKCSEWMLLRSLAFWLGDPLDSILSPMLVNIFMKLLGEVIQSFGLSCHQYVDGAHLFLALSADPIVDVVTVNQCLKAVL